MRITFISDTHGLHHELPELPGGDLLIHAGDSTNYGTFSDTKRFVEWFDSQIQYDATIFIAGNHDLLWERAPKSAETFLLNSTRNIYLQDNFCVFVNKDATESVKIYGSPWQPEFHNWAFNLPRQGKELQEKWNMIPDDTDILITHGPPNSILDRAEGNPMYLGCELLTEAVSNKKPKIHVFGHIHGGYGYIFKDNTHYINAAVLNDKYSMVNKPITVEWNSETNDISFINI